MKEWIKFLFPFLLWGILFRQNLVYSQSGSEKAIFAVLIFAGFMAHLEYLNTGKIFNHDDKMDKYL